MNAVTKRNPEFRGQIKELERHMAAFEQAELKTLHHFADGTYTRELHIPAGTLLTGKIHKTSCINILAQGEIMVVTDEGNYSLKAPHVFVSGPDVKKAGYVIKDAVWINVHPWNGEESVELVEQQVIEPEELERIECLG